MANVNPERVRILIDLIKEQRVELQMGDFYTDLKPMDEAGNYSRFGVHACGTAMCLAGTINYYRLSDGFKQDHLPLGPHRLSSASLAAEWLGWDSNSALDMRKANDLFFMHVRNEHNELMADYELLTFDQLPVADRVDITVKVLENLMNTGEVDWPAAFAANSVELEPDYYDHA